MQANNLLCLIVIDFLLYIINVFQCCVCVSVIHKLKCPCYELTDGILLYINLNFIFENIFNYFHSSKHYKKDECLR